MLKNVLLSILFAILAFSASAQFKLGLKFSPSFTSTRPVLVNDTLDIVDSGNNLKFSMGLIGDFEITETYIFSTGIIYSPKTFSMRIDGENGGSHTNPLEEYDVAYLQFPISLKLFTNEIVPDLAVFFQVGVGAEFKINDQAVEEEYTLISDFKFFDTNVILGGGVEYRAGINTVLYVEGSYQRGLLNVVKATEPSIGNEFDLRASVFMIDLGIKF